MSKSNNRGLGRGLDSLIPDQIDPNLDPTHKDDKAVSRTQDLFISDIKPNPEQPRRGMRTEELEELASSIKTHGILQPIVVVSQGSSYTIIAGERRWRAAKTAGLKTVPAIIRTLSDQAKLEIALIENIQRQELSPLELATALTKLNQQFNQSWDAIAKRLGKGTSTVSNVARLLGLPVPAKQALDKDQITEGHARQILALKNDPKKQQELLDLIVRHGWNVRRAEQFVLAYKSGAMDKTAAVRSSVSTTPETKQLSTRLKTGVRLQKLAKGGRLLIEYKDDKDLKRITEELID
jgi:ParB family chromosome partitioning protein